MDKEPENSPKSPHKTTISSSSSGPEQQPFIDSQVFPSGSFHMEDVNFYGPPLMEFGAFSSVLSPTPMLEFKANPAPTGGGDGEEEYIGVPMPQPLASLHEIPVPPFLSKTYDLVNDRTLDPIISWGSAGESFVVWDPVEFSRIVLPRNFKHNNFSSFVRQLNTYGFRKIDSDKWEFANEAFRRGEKHLLKNIQRRRTLQSQQTVSYSGPSTKAGKLELESEIETLRKERSEIMQEVVQLQQQQRGSVHHMEAVNERLQAAEKRQKQMVSFLAKLFQNPAFIARLKQTKEQRDIESPKMKRKFIKHQAHEPSEIGTPMEGEVVKYAPEWKSHPFVNPVDEEATALEFQLENLQSDELEAAQGFMNTPANFGEGTSDVLRDDPQFKGKSVIDPEYFALSPGIESMVKQEEIWSMGFECQTGMLNCSQEMWDNVDSYDMPEIVSSGGFSDIWDLGSLQAAGSSGTKWPSDEIPFNEPESDTDQTNNEK